MDLLKEIKTKIASLTGKPCESSIKAAIRHIEVAERYLSRSRTEQEDDLLNDVVYRSNQAFEGMLKEAYAVLIENDPGRMSPHQIEQYLLKEKVLSPRVLDLFTTYRQNWRNPSTHDHTLFFNDQEALLAIVNVSAFTAVLLDQIIEVLSFRLEQTEVAKKGYVFAKYLEGYDNLTFLEQVVALLKAFSADLSQSQDYLRKLHEAELLGRLGGFIAAVDLELQINREMLLEDNLRPDLVLFKKGEGVVLELKRARRFRGFLDDAAIAQVQKYLELAKLQNAVIYVPPFEMNQEMSTHNFDVASNRKIVILAPRGSDCDSMQKGDF